MIILSFNTESGALAAARQIWINHIIGAVAQGETVRNGGESHSDLSGFDDDYISRLLICAELDGAVAFNTGLTEKYSNVIKAYDLDKWYIPKPDAQYMTGVVGHTEMTLPYEWTDHTIF